MLVDVLLPPRPESVALAREAVSKACEKHDECCHTLLLLASELATNAVKHAKTEFRLTVERNDGRLVLAVTDAGQGEPRLKPLHPEELTEGGRGLVLVNKLAEDWGVARSDTRKEVWATVPCAA